MRFFAVFFLSLLFHLDLYSAEEDTTLIHVSGYAFDSTSSNRRLDDLMIINTRTSQGTFGKADGTFSLTIHKTDTIVVASTGYVFEKFCLADSLSRNDYFLRIPLTRLNVNLHEVTVFSPRDLQSIYNDIKKLGYNKKDFEISGVDALSSPITFLYQEFSRYERLKRHNAERINDDKKKELLRQLFANYVAHDIINLDDNEFDDFIDFCNVPESYLKTATQYDFCIYIKRKFEVYAMWKQHK